MAAENPQLVEQLDAVMRRMHKPSANYPIPEDSISRPMP